MKIYVKFKKPRTVKKFLEMFFSNTVGNKWSSSFAVPTYFDKDCTQIQSGPGRFRSPQDLLDCVNTYYPSVTMNQLIRTLVKLHPFSNTKFYPSYCNNIQRSIICWYPRYDPVHSIPFQGEDKFTWTKLLSNIGINSVVELVAATSD